MKIKTVPKLAFAAKIVFCLVGSLIFVTTAKAFHGSLEGMGGEAFSDPTQIIEMSDDWKKQAIKYENSARGADIVITLDQQMYPALSPIIQEYAKKHGLNIVVNSGTCGISAGMLSRKVADIGGYCCAPGLIDRLPGLRFHTLGIAPLTLIVHPDNPVDNITLEQARAIFRGDFYRWSELKVPVSNQVLNLPIQPVTRLHCKIRPGSWRLLLSNEDMFSYNILDIGAIPDMISSVAMKKAAIGYETLWVVRYYSEKGEKVKFLKINGYSPDELSHLLSRDYPLYRVYSITTWEGKNVENSLAKKLVDYLLQEVERLDSEFALIPASRLKKAGWKFIGNELVGEPQK